ncbi:MAG TPA: dihydrofolate reductase [Nitrospirota bacterium]|nr:dihydrofolate reductase [Nitrospirota bacterium]
MIIIIIAAMAENRVIGRNNKMPWDLPSDRRRFHSITRGHPVIMGRKTYESIGRPLSGRTNIVLTRHEGYAASGCVIVHHLKSAFSACTGADEVFICGGESIFRQTIALADRIYLTVIHRLVEGDAFFPEIPSVFTEVGREEVQDVMPYALVRYDRLGKHYCFKSPDASFDLPFRGNCTIF